MEGTKGDHLRDGVAIRELEVVRGPLWKYRIGNPKCFASDGEGIGFSCEKHAGEERVVEKISDGKKKLREIGDEDV